MGGEVYMLECRRVMDGVRQFLGNFLKRSLLKLSLDVDFNTNMMIFSSLDRVSISFRYLGANLKK